MGAGSVGKLSFELLVSPALIWTGVKWSLAIGFIGGLFPAVRAARMHAGDGGAAGSLSRSRA